MSKLADAADRLGAAAHNLRLDIILAAEPVLNCLTIPRKPDFVIGTKDDPYLRRWWIIPRNRFFNIYLHHIMRDDDDRALHDHPWWNCSILLKGSYIEHIPGKAWHPNGQTWRYRRRWRPYFRKATAAHRLELMKNCWKWRGIGMSRRLELQKIVPVWSLFITGPKIREWGFWCPQGWKHWRDFVSLHNTGEVGPGCGD